MESAEDCLLSETDMENEERRKKRISIEEQAVVELREHMHMEDEEKVKTRRWHIGKEIPIALLAGFAINVAGLVWGAATLNSKVENQKDVTVTAIAVQASIDARQDEYQRRSEDRLMAELSKINAKLDRLTEGRGR